MASGLHVLLLLLLCSVSSQAQLKVFQLSASDLSADSWSEADGYVKVFLGSEPLGRTSMVSNKADPHWQETFHHVGAQPGDVLRLEVYDEDVVFNDMLGSCHLPVQEGTQHLSCFLEEGGVLHYSYTLGSQ